MNSGEEKKKNVFESQIFVFIFFLYKPFMNWILLLLWCSFFFYIYKSSLSIVLFFNSSVTNTDSARKANAMKRTPVPVYVMNSLSSYCPSSKNFYLFLLFFLRCSTRAILFFFFNCSDKMSLAFGKQHFSFILAGSLFFWSSNFY